jgi:hypothetical protein
MTKILRVDDRRRKRIRRVDVLPSSIGKLVYSSGALWVLPLNPA